MATGFRARFDAGADFDFQKRVAQALAEAAVSVYSELATAPGHALRATYALAVIADAPTELTFNGQPIQSHPRTLAVARLLTTLGIDIASTDAQITTALLSVWSPLAGA